MAEATAGDAADFQTLVMHSVVYNNLRIQNLIDFIPASDGKVNFALYQGKVVIVSDQVPVDTTGAFPVYTTYILGNDVFKFGATLSNGSDDAIIGFEQWRDPRMGLGSGLNQIISRSQFALHPVGFSWLDTAVTGSVSSSNAPIYPNLSDLANDVNWDRKASSRKYIKFAVINSNG